MAGVIVDLFVSFLALLIEPVTDLLPSGHLALPDPSPIGDALASFDGLVPILGPLRVAAVMLAALAIFIVFRVFVFVRFLLLP